MNEKLTTKQREFEYIMGILRSCDKSGNLRACDTMKHPGLAQEIIKALNANTAEDEDKLKYLKQKFATSAENWRKLETQITLRKIDEFWTTHKDKFNEYWRISPGEVIAEIRRWLQQEDK